MFTLEKDPRFTHVVEVNKPVDGGYEAASFKATFRVMGVSELDSFDFNDGVASTRFLQDVVVDFADVQDDDGKLVPFSDRARDALVNIPFVRVALVKSYFGGVNRAALGN